MGIFDSFRRSSESSESEFHWKKGEEFGRTGFVVLDVKEGGMGVVYIIANLVNRSRIYAVKTIKDQYITDEQAVKRFWAEAQSWVELPRHENLVCADHVFEIEGKPYIYLEYVDGGSLRSQIGNLGLSRALDLAVQTCTGMEAVRTSKGLVHRDIKPENCLLTRAGVLKITDWGLSKVLDKTSNPTILKTLSTFHSVFTLTHQGVVLGTPAYMPPEQWEGLKTDIRSDIYSFGCMFYEMLTGKQPFTGKDFETLENKHLHVNPEPIANVPRELNNLIKKCLEKEPEDRFDNFGAIGNAIVEANKSTGKGKSIKQRVSEGTTQLSSSDLRQKGFGLLHLRRDQEAIQYFEEAIEKDPRDYVALSYMAYCLGNLNKHREAIEACEKAIRIEPGFANAYGNLGYSYSKLGQFSKAIEYYEKAIRLNPGSDNFNNITIAYSDWGDSSRDPAKYEQAIRYADMGLKIDSKYYRTWISKGQCQLKLKRYSDAINSFNQAVNINPRAQPAFIGLWQCYEAMGDTEKANKYARMAIQIDKNYTT